MFEGQGADRRPARRELGVGMQDQPTSTVKTGTGQLHLTPQGAPLLICRCLTGHVSFFLLTEAGGRRQEAAEGMDSPGETVEELEGAGEQGKPHCVRPTWFEIL